MICMRYHSIIFSILAKKPFFAISYSNKTKAILDKIPGITYTDLSKPEAKKIEFTVQEQQIGKAKQKFIKSAEKNFQKLRNTLECGS